MEIFPKIPCDNLDMPNASTLKKRIRLLPALLTINELADLTNFDVFTIYRQAKAGLIPGAKQFGKTWRIDRKKAFKHFGISE